MPKRKLSPAVKKKNNRYRAADKAYQKKPEVLAKQRKRNKDRRAAEKAGKVRKGDGKDIHHVGGVSKPGAKKRIMSASKNRSMK